MNRRKRINIDRTVQEIDRFIGDLDPQYLKEMAAALRALGTNKVYAHYVQHSQNYMQLLIRIINHLQGEKRKQQSPEEQARESIKRHASNLQEQISRLSDNVDSEQWDEVSKLQPTIDTSLTGFKAQLTKLEKEYQRARNLSMVKRKQIKGNKLS